VQKAITQLEALTQTALANHYNQTHYAADVLKKDFDNVPKPANASALADSVAAVPEQGIDALIRAQQPKATQLFNGLLTIEDPSLFLDASAKIRNSVVGAVVEATGEHANGPCHAQHFYVPVAEPHPFAGIRYNPCIVAEGPVGALVVAELATISPRLITVGPSGAALVAIGEDPSGGKWHACTCMNAEGVHVHAGINITPTLISVLGSADANVVAGFSVSPSLIAVRPAVESTVTSGLTVGSPDITANIIPWPPQPPDKP
jgi:hypothetical protein